MKTISQLFNFSIVAGGLLAVGSIAYAGFQYAASAGNSSIQGDAKDRIWQAVIGLLLLGSAVVILNAIDPNIITAKIWSLSELSGELGGSSIPPKSGGLSDADARSKLDPRIALKPGASLQGIQQVVIDAINKMQADCGCSILINHGTDGQHTSGSGHYVGCKLDITPKGPLTSYITGSCPQGSPWKNGTQTWKCGGSTWAREDPGTSNDHWDVKSC